MIDLHEVIVNGSEDLNNTYEGIVFLTLQYLEVEGNVNVVIENCSLFLQQLHRVLIREYPEWNCVEHTDVGYVQIQHGKIFLFSSSTYIDNGNTTITNVDGFENENIIKIPIL